MKEEIYKIIDRFLVEAKDQNGKERSLEQLNQDRHLAAERFEELIKRKEQISMLEGSITEREHSIDIFQLALDNAQVKVKHNQDECWCCSEIKAIKRAAEEDLEYLRKKL